MHHCTLRPALACLPLVFGVSSALAQATDFHLGSAIAASQAERSIAIAADTRWANVRQNESIRFVAAQAEFGWRFDGSRSAVDLAQIAPAGFLAHPFIVYVAPTASGRRGN